MNLTLASEEIAALKEALVSTTKRSEEVCRQSQLLKSELVLVRTERDLLQEQLNKFKRDLFAAKSEASAAHQKDLFFNEAEHLGATAQPGVEETAGRADAIDVPAHKRKKRGRKPIDPALPRQVVRHELPEDERVCRQCLGICRRACGWRNCCSVLLYAIKRGAVTAGKYWARGWFNT